MGIKSFKITLCLTSALAAFCGVNTLTGSAYSGDIFADIETEYADGFYTVITDTEGETRTLSGVIDADSIEECASADKIASYELFQNGVSFMKTELNDIFPQGSVFLSSDDVPVQNGYYSTRFTVSAEDGTEAFITGLSPAYLDMVQRELISAALDGTVFEMEALGFIDTEKTNMPSDGDDELCWAASAANVLHYTGWGAKAGFSSTDDIFEDFIDHFTDFGSAQLYGLDWFFNGTYPAQSLDGWSVVKDYGSSGRYLTQYSTWDVMESVDIEYAHENINTAITGLENGSGAGVALGWINENGTRNGGHAITLWGYICDKDFSEQDSSYYKALIVSDSDSDMPSDTDRRTAPNKLHVLNMEPYTENGYDSWRFADYYDGTGVLENIYLLYQYNEEVPYETDKDATLDKIADPDLHFWQVNVSNDAYDTELEANNFAAGNTIYITPVIENLSDLYWDGETSYNAEITDSSGVPVWNGSGTYSGAIPPFGNEDISQTTKLSVEGLSPGEYTVTLSLNPEKTVQEAYYYNNTTEYEFTVIELDTDISQAFMSAEIGPFTNGAAETIITYEGLYELGLPESTEYTLMQSYYKDGSWSAWEQTYTSDEEPAGNVSLMSNIPPESCTVYSRGDRVRFRLRIMYAGGTVMNLHSDESELYYTAAEVILDETSTTELTPLENGAKALAEGESLAFRVRNSSTYDGGAVQFEAAVYAERNGERIELYRMDGVPLEYGETSDVISFDSWDMDLSGTYSIIASAEGDFGSAELELGTLCIEENISYEVTTEYDVTDPYDGDISLREAVDYIIRYGSSSDKVTLTDNIGILYVDSPIMIDGPVFIDGAYSPSGADRIAAFVYGYERNQLFKVTETGELSLISLCLHSGRSDDFGGSIENLGGTVYAEQCMFSYSESGLSGGAVYSDGGSMVLKNCSFRDNTSGYGGAVGITGDAKLDMLNCTFTENTSNGGAVYNDGGDAAIIYSTFADNSALSSGGGAVTSLGNTNMIGCLAVKNGSLDLSGNINVYGSCITAADETAAVDNVTVSAGSDEIFVSYSDRTAAWCYFDTVSNASYFTELSPIVLEGVYVKNDGGNVVYSADGSEWTATNIGSVFDDEEYLYDIHGDEHGRLFGSDSSVCSETRITGLGDGFISIYSPIDRGAALIERAEAVDGSLEDVHITETELSTGTNSVDIDTENIPDVYMLWNSLENMEPLCEEYMP